MKKILSFCILSFLIISAAAQVPSTFHFQGAIKDIDGIPVNDTKFIEFRIYNAETDGIMLWNEGPVAVEIINGLFSMELGGINPFPEGLFDSSPLYMTFALASGEMEPRQKMLAVPFALKAASSDEDWQMAGNYIINLTDSVGIGTATPQTRFEVNAIMRLTPAGMTELCDLTLEGSIYYDINLKEYCFCNGTEWMQLDGGGYCDCIDLDGDGVDICDPEHPYDNDGLAADCDDGNSEVYPGNLEYCDGIDNDCDPNTPDGSSEPNFGNSCDGVDSDLCGEGTIVCLAGTLACSDLTDDNEEICDGVDNDCDGETDEELIPPQNANQNGVCSAGYQICTGSGGWVDDYSTIPGYEDPEVSCDDIDNNCDGEIDEGLREWLYYDQDGDMYGDPDSYAYICIGTPGWVSNGLDCNDNDDLINPDAIEIPDDGIDQDCNGFDATSCYYDNDQDGYGGIGAYTIIALDGECNAYEYEAYNDLDCDDNNNDIFPGATEIPGDGVDQDCDNTETCYLDNDDDGYRPDGTSTVLSTDMDCNDAGEAIASDPTGDCNDSDPNISPVATEICDNIDNNCNLEIDEDFDLLNDPNNCGDCDNVCNAPNATSICNTGICGIGSCNPGYGNCDGNTANGCETDLNNDDLNCGACGNDCGVGYICVDGQCEPL